VGRARRVASGVGGLARAPPRPPRPGQRSPGPDATLSDRGRAVDPLPRRVPRVLDAVLAELPPGRRPSGRGGGETSSVLGSRATLLLGRRRRLRYRDRRGSRRGGGGADRRAAPQRLAGAAAESAPGVRPVEP